MRVKMQVKRQVNLLLVFLTSTVVTGASIQIQNDEITEFLEPLKNITAPPGTNLEFSCTILHLGNSRVIWFYKAAEKNIDSILAVNGLKVTRNPKISFSVIPRSGDITESILYIFNVGAEEAGIYTCGVNTEPMILQKGTLEISATEKTVREIIVTTTTTPRPSTTAPPPLSPSSTRTSEDGFFCVNFPQMWQDTKRETEKFAKDVWHKVSALF